MTSTIYVENFMPFTTIDEHLEIENIRKELKKTVLLGKIFTALNNIISFINTSSELVEIYSEDWAIASNSLVFQYEVLRKIGTTPDLVEVLFANYYCLQLYQDCISDFEVGGNEAFEKNLLNLKDKILEYYSLDKIELKTAILAFEQFNKSDETTLSSSILTDLGKLDIDSQKKPRTQNRFSFEFQDKRKSQHSQETHESKSLSPR